MFKRIKSWRDSWNAYGAVEKLIHRHEIGALDAITASQKMSRTGLDLETPSKCIVLKDILAFNLRVLGKKEITPAQALDEITDARTRLNIPQLQFLKAVLVPLVIDRRRLYMSPEASGTAFVLQALFRNATQGREFENHSVTVSEQLGTSLTDICIAFKSAADEPFAIADGCMMTVPKMIDHVKEAFPNPNSTLRVRYLQILESFTPKSFA